MKILKTEVTKVVPIGTMFKTRGRWTVNIDLGIWGLGRSGWPSEKTMKKMGLTKPMFVWFHFGCVHICKAQFNDSEIL